MKVRTVGILGVVGLGVAALLSRNRSRECKVSMHPEDWLGLTEGDTHRRYRSLGQALHHTKELAGLIVPVGELYLRRPISAGVSGTDNDSHRSLQ